VRRIDRLLVALAALAYAVFLPKVFWPEAGLYAHLLGELVLNAFGASAKLLGLLAGAVYATRSALHLERGNPARLAWFFLGGWLGCFFAGQVVLSTYALALGRSAPLPSVGDAFFLLGYAMAIVAAVLFIRAYVSSGFPIGTVRGHAASAALAAALFAAAGYALLAPVARSETPFAERAINVAYPVLDFVTLIPSLIMIRITLHFRGGRVWTVWAGLLVSLVFMAAGDILFAYVTSIGLKPLEPLVDLLFVVGYLCAGWGTIQQLRLETT